MGIKEYIRLFLEQVMDVHHVIALSYLETGNNGKVYRVEGSLKSCVSKIVRCRLKKDMY